MGNQARQRQELELWQVVSPSVIENKNRPVRQIKVVKTGNIRAGGTGRRKNVQALRRQKARRRQALICRCLVAIWITVLSLSVIFLGKIFYQNIHVEEKRDGPIMSASGEIPLVNDDDDTNKPKIQEDFLSVSEYNRPGTKLASVNNIFVHYTANPKTSAAQNRSYFENLGQTHERAASAHFIIGYEGEIIQCIPLDEEAYAVVNRNKDSISIECCFIEEDGSFTQETYDSLIAMLAWLTDKYDLEAKDILRHYDCGGKLCPIYYVEHEDAWERLLYDVEQYKF